MNKKDVRASFTPPPPAEFIENSYLKANPDVVEAIARGSFSSGFEHWLLHGREEGRILWTKADIINFWGKVRGYRTYLEICTPTAGGRYAEIDRSKYQTCHRLMYRCPIDFADGIEIDFRSADLDIDDCVKQIHNKKLRYDVVLVDAFHEYEPSLRDLKTAIELVGDGGTVVVHDCDPPSEELACPHFIPTSWAGVTYKAYLDFVMGHDDLDYFTVDTDWGCGIIRRRNRNAAQVIRLDNERLMENWRRLGNDFHSAFHFLKANKEPLLNLISLGEFMHREGEASVFGRNAAAISGARPPTRNASG